MNEEYVLIAGIYWRLKGIPVYLWRNHYGGTWRTVIAVKLATVAFCTSRYSYTARFKKTLIMPVGVDVDSLRAEEAVIQVPRSILFLARFDGSKRPMLLVEALGILREKGIEFSATFAGGPTDPNSDYPNKVRSRAEQLGLGERVQFVGAVPNTETYRYYRSHEIFVNCSESGMLDKTIFKAAAAGCLVLSSSDDIAQHIDPMCIFKDNDSEDLARKLGGLLETDPEIRQQLDRQFRTLVEQNTLAILSDRLVEEMDKSRG
jgi:glycosyltransferase involved in cell wall biosynthesis